jgi:hypothetical protein
VLAPANPAVSLVKQVRNEWERLGEAIDKAAEVETERPDEAETILAPVQRTLDAAMDELLKTPPTTVAGAREAIAWFTKNSEPLADLRRGRAHMNAFTDRRSMLLGTITAGAAATVAAIPAMAAAELADDVFAALEAHKAAWARLDGLDEIADLDDYEAYERGSLAADAALDELTATPPTTVAGMRAAIAYLVELDGHADYLPTLVRSSILRSPLLAG